MERWSKSKQSIIEKYGIRCEIVNDRIEIEMGETFKKICKSLLWDVEHMSLKFQQAAVRRIKARANSLTPEELSQFGKYGEVFGAIFDENYISDINNAVWDSVQGGFLEQSSYWTLNGKELFESKAQKYLDKVMSDNGTNIEGVRAIQISKLVPLLFLECCQMYKKAINKEVTIKAGKRVNGKYKKSDVMQDLNSFAEATDSFLKLINNRESYWEEIHTFEKRTGLISLFALRDELTKLKSPNKEKWLTVLGYLSFIGDVDLRVEISREILYQVEQYEKAGAKINSAENVYFNLFTLYKIVFLWEGYTRLLEELIEEKLFRYGDKEKGKLFKVEDDTISTNNAYKVFRGLKIKAIVSSTLKEVEVPNSPPIEVSCENNKSEDVWGEVVSIFRKGTKDYSSGEWAREIFNYETWIRDEYKYQCLMDEIETTGEDNEEKKVEIDTFIDPYNEDIRYRLPFIDGIDHTNGDAFFNHKLKLH